MFIYLIPQKLVNLNITSTKYSKISLQFKIFITFLISFVYRLHYTLSKFATLFLSIVLGEFIAYR